MLGLILPIWRSKSILMRAEATGAEVCCGALSAVADLLETSEEEIRGNAAAPSAAATPSFRKLRRAGSLMVIEVSPFSSGAICAYSEDSRRPQPDGWARGRHEYLRGNVYSSTGDFGLMIFGRDEVTRTARGGEIRESAIARVERGKLCAARATLSAMRIKYIVMSDRPRRLCAHSIPRADCGGNGRATRGLCATDYAEE